MGTTIKRIIFINLIGKPDHILINVMTLLNLSNLQVIDDMQQIFKFLHFSQGFLCIRFKQCYHTSKPNKLTGYR